MIGGGIRSRAREDLDRCALLLASLDPAERYPACWPGDVRAWLSPPDLLGAWVAEDHGAVVAHVALRAPAGSRTAMLTRLWVAPDARGRGVATALCDVACARAAALSLLPSLEVACERVAAIAMYERSGWTRASSEPRPMVTGGSTLVHDYVRPA